MRRDYFIYFMLEVGREKNFFKTFSKEFCVLKWCPRPRGFHCHYPIGLVISRCYIGVLFFGFSSWISAIYFKRIYFL